MTINDENDEFRVYNHIIDDYLDKKIPQRLFDRLLELIGLADNYSGGDKLPPTEEIQKKLKEYLGDLAIKTTEKKLLEEIKVLHEKYNYLTLGDDGCYSIRPPTLIEFAKSRMRDLSGYYDLA